MSKLINRHMEIWRSQSWIFVRLSLTEAKRIVKSNLLAWTKNNSPENLSAVEKNTQ